MCPINLLDSKLTHVRRPGLWHVRCKKLRWHGALLLNEFQPRTGCSARQDNMSTMLLPATRDNPVSRLCYKQQAPCDTSQQLRSEQTPVCADPRAQCSKTLCPHPQQHVSSAQPTVLACCRSNNMCRPTPVALGLSGAGCEATSALQASHSRPGEW